jgi:hypothetical protein
MEDMTLNDLASILIKEAFHSFEIGDKFTSDLLCGIAYYRKLTREVTLKQMKSKVTGFIQHKVKTGTIERIKGEKDKGYQVYQKVEDLQDYKTLAIDPIPEKYLDFAYIWNELDVGETVTADDFYNILKQNEIETTYVGQSSKFLWLISDRGLADCQINSADEKRNLYIRIDSIPDYVLKQTGTKFMKISSGKYQSCLNHLPL